MCTLTLFAVSLLCVVSHAVSDHNDVGVMIWPDDEMDSKLSPKSARRLISSSSCASGSTSGCSSSNPAGCPCPAFTDDERRQILDLHNYRRELAASGNEVCASSGGFSTQSCPAGSDMNALLWDEQLETIATYWAHQCNFAHHSNERGDEEDVQYKTLCDENGCLAVGYDGDYIGENIAAGATSGSPSWDMDDILGKVTSWYDESEYYYWATKTSYDQTGHWTAGVWAKTRYIGCGYAACDTNSPFGSSFSNWLMFVCKYFPGGNYGSSYPYTEGTKCSDCEDDRSSCSGDDGALCDGGMCLNCAVDYFNADCGYDSNSCPSMYYGDGIGDDDDDDDGTEATPSTTTTTTTDGNRPDGSTSSSTTSTSTTGSDDGTISLDDTLSCGETVTGYLADETILDFAFVNMVSQQVTFTNCESEFDTKMYLIDSSGAFIQSQSTNSCDGDDCYESGDNYCSTPYRETFTMDPLSVGTYTVRITPWSVGGDYELEAICSPDASTTSSSTSPTASPSERSTSSSASPTASPTLLTPTPTASPTADGTTMVLTSDPICSYGLLNDNGDICCPSDCTQCGGIGCRSAGSNCCDRSIRPMALSCDSNVAPCVIYRGDYDCSEGVTNECDTVCCPTSCGTCGGRECASSPGGATDCCAGSIWLSGLSCDDYDAPCLLSPAYTNHAFGTFLWSAVERLQESPLLTVAPFVLMLLLAMSFVAYILMRAIMCCIQYRCKRKSKKIRRKKKAKYVKVNVESDIEAECDSEDHEPMLIEAKGLI